MAAGSSEVTSLNTELGMGDLSALHEALCPVSAKYKYFGLQIGVDINEIKKIEGNYKDSSEFLLEILCLRLRRNPAFTCGDIDKALRSRTVDEHTLADEFQSKFECKSITSKHEKPKKESHKKNKATKPNKSVSEKETITESEEELKIQKEVESQVHERDEPKSKIAKKRACKREKLTRNQSASVQPEPDEYEKKNK